MKLARFARTSTIAVIGIAALGIAAGTAHADPTPPLVSGQDQGVGYSTTTTADGTGVTTILDTGTFRLDGTSNTVEVIDAAGASIATIPLAYRVGDQEFSIAPLIGLDDRRLTLTPETDPALATQVARSTLPVTDVNSQTRFLDELNKASFGAGVSAAIGAGIGLVIGCVVGVFVGCIPGVLVGAAAGGVIGLINTGGYPLQSAAFDYFTGQP
ncbi:hypothetical protein [Rhodococcoides kyotonense]|uniref:DUF8020 domain-containing protein n=1 Tax=Rhodococcoides kyotonense TaxID=398843 RepID=A0A239MTM6_9NOCA|nr:hypothetical protein [Rhodococcus kyotonensis]SNT45840.1 hypothetical protein SAMN05421642_12224 [Rhodococcus kyotonensis]